MFNTGFKQHEGEQRMTKCFLGHSYYAGNEHGA